MFSIGKHHFSFPCLLLAPMEDVSSAPFRAICRQNGADIVFSEFISSEALIRDAMKSKKKMFMLKDEHPVAIQLFGGDEEVMAEAAQIVDSTDADWIDINFGCPVKKVVCKGAGAAVLKDIDKMVRITKSVVNACSKPVTVKTRLGWDDDHINIMEVAEKLQDVGIHCLAIHGRTRKQMYKGEANWDMIKQVKQNANIHIPIIGNGDVDSPEKAKYLFETCHVDGIMIGRAAIGNPWMFNEIKYYINTGKKLEKISLEKKIDICLLHLQQNISLYGERRAVIEMRKFYHNYLKGYKNSKDLRKQLMSLVGYTQIENHLKTFVENP